jgi:hypothetical protein
VGPIFSWDLNPCDLENLDIFPKRSNFTTELCSAKTINNHSLSNNEENIETTTMLSEKHQDPLLFF